MDGEREAERKRCRLTTGLQRLELWAATADQGERNRVYDVLFAVADGSVFWRYRVMRDAHRPGEFSVVVRDDLIVKVDFPAPACFAILYVGTRGNAEGLDVDVDAA
ncbi:hypothetical protein CFN78_17390 [Amycolatopsis antarctica]|uniref:Uncharacterized protein n=1 Tax=Amycolatopsis antarctica TaxID=1854586 RepID=A0A263D0H2_9PSEU|nr:DUF6235 family protein [Amycolatopsis antarctica]OZM71922.1 hypothetical protein CFN78_17390 [Amycolatopsis antarctica]